MNDTAQGHASWLIGSGERHLLVDPVLAQSFGTTAELQFVLNPSRNIDVDSLPPVDGILLTTEHLQHFQPRSFRTLLERGCLPPVHVHRMFPACASDVLVGMGFEVVRHGDGEEANVGPWRFAFFTNPGNVHFWDSRVAALVVRDGRHAMVVQSDTLPSAALAAHVGRISTPLRCVIATYNALLTHQGGGAGLSNALPIKPRTQRGAAGIRLLAGALVEPFRALPPSPMILMAGSGFVDSKGVLSPSGSRLQELARIADALSMGTRIAAPSPGQRVELEPNGAWDEVAWVQRTPLKDGAPAPRVESPWRFTQVHETGEGQVSAEALRDMARAIIGSPFGRELLRMERYLGRWLGAERFVIQLLDGEGADLVLDLSRVEFVRRAPSGDAALRAFPFGLRTTGADLSAVLRGHLQIWELSMVAARQWYVCESSRSPMAFLYSYFNEAVQPELARRCFESELGVR